MVLNLTGTFYAGSTFQGLTGTPAIITYNSPLTLPITRPNMGYYTGFLGTGVGQTQAGPSILSSIATGLETILPSIFGGGTARTPPMLPGGTGGATPVPIGTAVTQTPQSHPTLTKIGAVVAAGGAAAATGGMISTALHSIGVGGGARYAPAGTKGYHMIKKGPHAGQWTRNRHRNVANIRALRRALSRAHGFERICKKVMHFTHGGRRMGRPVFRRRRRAK